MTCLISQVHSLTVIKHWAAKNLCQMPLPGSGNYVSAKRRKIFNFTKKKIEGRGLGQFLTQNKVNLTVNVLKPCIQCFLWSNFKAGHATQVTCGHTCGNTMTCRSGSPATMDP